MINYYLKNYLRSIKTNANIFSLNILGMTLGLLVFILINYYSLHQLNYDSFHKNYDRIVRLTTKISNNGNETHFAISSKPSAPTLKSYFATIKKSVRTSRFPGDISIDDNIFNNETILFSDTSFFSVFSFEILEGKTTELLQNPLDIIITQEAASRYFGEKPAIGQSLNIQSRGINKDFQVVGIVKDPPSNSTINFSIICPFENVVSTFGETYGHVSPINSYLLLNSPDNLNQIRKRLQEFYDTKLGNLLGIITFGLQPFSDIYFTTALSYDLGIRGNKTNIQILMLLSFFILALSCINFMNLSTASAQSRGKEIGMKKILGASKKTLVLQAYFETFLTVLIAISIAFGFSQVLLPYASEFAGVELIDSLSDKIDLIMYLGLIWFLVSIFSGFYLAVVLSSQNTMACISDRFSYGSVGLGFRKVLVTMQFMVSAIAIGAVFIIQDQIEYVLEKDLGYDHNEIINISTSNSSITDDKNEILKTSMLSIAGIKNATSSTSGITFEMPRFPFNMAEDSASNFQILNFNDVDENYLDVHHIPLLFGRKLTSNDHTGFIINQEAAKQLGYSKTEEIVGKTLIMGQAELETRGTIVGVTSNFHFRALHYAIEPLVLVKRPYAPNQNRNFMTLLFDKGSSKDILKKVEVKWSEIFPNIELNHSFVSEDYQNNYSQEQRINEIFNIVTAIIIFISVLGLFGLTIITVDKKTKEIGIRKTLGASIIHIIYVLGKPVLILVFLGNLLAIPIVLQGAQVWLESFIYVAEFDWFIFPSTFLISTLIAFFTTIIIIRKAATKNPIEALKYE